jgi:predicted permease
VAALAMGAAVVAVGAVLPDGGDTRSMLIALVGKVAVGALVFAAVAVALGMDELHWAAGRRLAFLRRLQR